MSIEILLFQVRESDLENKSGGKCSSCVSDLSSAWRSSGGWRSLWHNFVCVKCDFSVSFTCVCSSVPILSLSSSWWCVEVWESYFRGLLNNFTGSVPVLPTAYFSTSSKVQPWREIRRQTASQQVGRSRSESQTSAGDICPSFSVEPRAQTVLCLFPTWFTCQCFLWDCRFVCHCSVTRWNDLLKVLVLLVLTESVDIYKRKIKPGLYLVRVRGATKSLFSKSQICLKS